MYSYFWNFLILGLRSFAQGCRRSGRQHQSIVSILHIIPLMTILWQKFHHVFSGGSFGETDTFLKISQEGNRNVRFPLIFMQKLEGNFDVFAMKKKLSKHQTIKILSSPCQSLWTTNTVALRDLTVNCLHFNETHTVHETKLAVVELECIECQVSTNPNADVYSPEMQWYT